MTATSIVIGASVIDRLLNDSEAKRQFRFLANPPMQPRGGCCGRRRRMTVNYNNIKRRIAGLADTDQKQLLRLLGASSARIHFKVGRQRYEQTLPG